MSIFLSKEIRASWVACMIGTLVMDIVVIIEFYLTGVPLNTSFVLYGAIIGSNEWTGLFLHILFGSMLGVLFGLLISRVDTLRVDSFNKGLRVGVAAGLITIPLGCIPFALILGIPFWLIISMMILPHLVWGFVLGSLTSHLLNNHVRTH